MTQPSSPLIAAACFLTLVPLTVSAGVNFESRAAARLIHIDGNPKDWDGLPMVYLEDSLGSLSITHNDDNIYLMFQFGDERLAQQLLSRGVILWLNGNGKTKNKEEEFGVRYAGSEEIGEYFSAADSKPTDDQSARRARRLQDLATLRPQPGELTVIRFGIKDVVPEGLPGGPEAASDTHDGVFCYEIRIPVQEIGGKVADQPPTKKRKVGLGIQIGGTTEGEREHIEAAIQDALGRGGGPASTTGGGGSGGGGGMGGMGGMGGGGRGGMGGAGGGGGGRPGTVGDRSAMKDRLNPKIQWLTILMIPETN